MLATALHTHTLPYAFWPTFEIVPSIKTIHIFQTYILLLTRSGVARIQSIITHILYASIFHKTQTHHCDILYGVFTFS